MSSDEDYLYDSSDSQSDVSDFDPEAPILEPVQKRIEAQLQKRLEELSQELRETKGELKIVRQQREDCGVELYNYQQQLAKLQQTLEKEHERYSVAQTANEEKLQEQAQLTAQSDALRRLVDELHKRYELQQTDIVRVSETLRKVEEYNEQLKGEVLVERRAAYKAEEDISKMEKEKMRQDQLVDGLQEQIRMLAEQKAMLDDQVRAQREETEAARDTLTEALAEMENVNFEKKQLVQQWRTAVIGMQRRDEAMKKTEEALEEQQDNIRTLDMEIEGNRKELSKVQTENGKLAEFLSRIQNEVMTLEKQIQGLEDRKQQNAQMYVRMKQSMEAADAESKALDREIKAYTSQISDLDKAIQKRATEVVEVEKKAMDLLSAQTTLKQESRGALGDIEKLKKQIQAKEMHLTEMENELARIRVDTLQTESHNEVLKGTLEEIDAELKSRNALIERMQTEIRRRHDEIDRKQKQLDHLNSQYESIMTAQGSVNGEHVGPLEATIKSLTKTISEKTQENRQLQHQWIKLQTELVNDKNKSNELSETIQELQAKCTVLGQKRDRLLAYVAEERNQIASLEKKAGAAHLDMKRVNTLLSQTVQGQEAMAHDTLMLENELTERMKACQKESVELQRKIEEIKLAKLDVTADILNYERDIMVWEKKIQLIKETEAALDPDVGKEETRQMKREISIMEQRLDQLKREQRLKVEELEKLVDQREILRTKGLAVQQTANKHGVTRLTVNKENYRLAEELKSKKKEAQNKEKQIKDSLAATERTAVEVEQTQEEVDHMEEQIEELKARCAIAFQDQQRAEDERGCKQRSLQRLHDAERGAYQLSHPPQQTEQETAQVSSQITAVTSSMQDILNAYPYLSHDIEDLLRGLQSTPLASSAPTHTQ